MLPKHKKFKNKFVKNKVKKKKCKKYNNLSISSKQYYIYNKVKKMLKE